MNSLTIRFIDATVLAHNSHLVLIFLNFPIDLDFLEPWHRTHFLPFDIYFRIQSIFFLISIQFRIFKLLILITYDTFEMLTTSHATII
jgi:hypothetical protein